MKFFFSIITFFFVLITQSYSQNCNPDEYNDGMMIKEYEAEYNYKAEEAYLFGKKIQKLLLDKDLKGFIDVTTGNLKTDLENRFKNTQSIEAFFSPDAFNKITKGKVYCKPMGISGAKTFWIGLSDLVYTLKDNRWLVTEYKNQDILEQELSSNEDMQWLGSCYIEYDGKIIVNNEICSIRQNGFSVSPTSYKHINEANDFQIVAVRDVPCDDGSKDCAYYFYADKHSVTGEILYQINYNIEKERSRYPANLGEDFTISEYKPNDTERGLCFLKDEDKFCFAYVYKGTEVDFSVNKSFDNYSIMLEESNESVMLVNRPHSIEIFDYGKFEFTRIAYINAENNKTPLFIQPSNIEVKGDYKSLMQPKYQIDNAAYEFTEDDEKQIIKIKSVDNNLNINNKIEEYFKSKSELTVTILSGGVYASSKFLPVTNVKQLKDLFKDNPQSFCRLLSEKDISGKINRELKSDLKSLLQDEFKKCEDDNIIINIASNKYLGRDDLPNLMCTELSATGEAIRMVPFDLSEDYNEVVKISESNVRFNFEVDGYYALANFDRFTNKLRLLKFSDFNYKNIKGITRYNCENEDEIKNRVVRKSEPNIAWKVDGKFIIPECFDTVWLSGDNYEAFYEQYIKDDGTAEWGNKSFQNFVVNIGTHLNKEIPLNHSINPGWSGVSSLSLTKSIKGCLSKEAHTDVMYEITTYYDGNKGNTQNDIGYEVLEDYDVSIGKKLAPHIKLQFESIKKVEVSEWGGGSMGHTYRQITYGLISIDGQKVLLPLKNHIKF